MIKKFTRDRGDSYHNAIELTWLFVMSEIIEYLTMFGAYDANYQLYNPRRVVWITVFTVLFIAVITTFLLTAYVYLAKTFGVM